MFQTSNEKDNFVLIEGVKSWMVERESVKSRGNEMTGAGTPWAGGEATFAHTFCAFFPIEIYLNASSNNFRSSTPIDLLPLPACVELQYEQ